MAGVVGYNIIIGAGSKKDAVVCGVADGETFYLDIIRAVYLDTIWPCILGVYYGLAVCVESYELVDGACAGYCYLLVVCAGLNFNCVAGL